MNLWTKSGMTDYVDVTWLMIRKEAVWFGLGLAIGTALGALSVALGCWG